MEKDRPPILLVYIPPGALLEFLLLPPGAVQWTGIQWMTAIVRHQPWMGILG